MTASHFTWTFAALVAVSLALPVLAAAPESAPVPLARPDTPSSGCVSEREIERLELLMHASIQRSARLQSSLNRLERDVRRCRSGRLDGPLGSRGVDCAGLGIERLGLRDRLLAERIERDAISERMAAARRAGEGCADQ